MVLSSGSLAVMRRLDTQGTGFIRRSDMLRALSELGTEAARIDETYMFLRIDENCMFLRTDESCMFLRIDESYMFLRIDIL